MNREEAAAIGKYLSQNQQDPEARQIGESIRHAYLLSENYGNYDFLENGESLVLQKLAKFELRMMFDVGANLGGWTKLALHFHPSATIHCFEVVPPIASRLAENLRDRPNCVVQRLGLSSVSGPVRVKFFPQASEQSSLIDLPVMSPHEIVESRAVMGDEYLAQQNIKQVDFMKIDVEGAEYWILEGLRRSLSEGNIHIIQFEYGKANIITKNLLFDFYRLLSRYGYAIGKIYPKYVEFREYDFSHEDFVGPNYLAVKKQLSDQISVLSH